MKSLVSFVYGLRLVHCLGINYFGKPNPTLRPFCFWQCFDVSVWNRHDVKGRPRLGKEGWIVTKSGFAVSLFFKSQFWLWREEAAEQDYLVLSPENPLEMEFKSVAKLFNNNFKKALPRYQPTCTTTWPCLFWYIISNHNSQCHFEFINIRKATSQGQL